jgi:pimeloyl-ACP methyl ester carboxylesterase
MPQMLYLHGSGYTQDSFRAQAEAFPGSDPISLPGHPAGKALASVEECSQWLVRYIEWKGASPVVIAGNSLGGAIALHCALDVPEMVAGLVLIGSGARLRVSDEIFQMIDRDWPACIETLVDWALADGASDELRQRAAGWHRIVGRESTRCDYGACNTFDVIDRLGEIQCPALIIVGADDKMTPPKYSKFLHERLAGSVLEIVEDAGHVVMAEKPERVNAAIASFLATLTHPI